MAQRHRHHRLLGRQRQGICVAVHLGRPVTWSVATQINRRAAGAAAAAMNNTAQLQQLLAVEPSADVQQAWLLAAAAAGTVTALTMLCQRAEMDIDAALAKVVNHGHLAAAQLLTSPHLSARLHLNANYHHRHASHTCVATAIRRRDTAMLKLLLHTPSPGRHSGAVTWLTKAVHADSIDAVRLLCRAPARHDIHGGMSGALMAAVHAGAEDIVRHMVLGCQACKMSMTTSLTAQAITAAAQRNHVDVFRLLCALPFGAVDIGARPGGCVRGRRCSSLLEHAVRHKHDKIAAHLLQLPCFFGITVGDAAEFLLTQAVSNSDLLTLRALCTAPWPHANIQASLAPNMLTTAVLQGRAPIVKFLLHRPTASRLQADRVYSTLVRAAVTKRNLDIVRALCEAPSALNIQPAACCNSAMLTAVAYNMHDIVAFFRGLPPERGISEVRPLPMRVAPEQCFALVGCRIAVQWCCMTRKPQWYEGAITEYCSATTRQASPMTHVRSVPKWTVRYDDGETKSIPCTRPILLLTRPSQAALGAFVPGSGLGGLHVRLCRGSTCRFHAATVSRADDGVGWLLRDAEDQTVVCTDLAAADARRNIRWSRFWPSARRWR